MGPPRPPVGRAVPVGMVGVVFVCVAVFVVVVVTVMVVPDLLRGVACLLYTSRCV